MVHIPTGEKVCKNFLALTHWREVKKGPGSSAVNNELIAEDAMIQFQLSYVSGTRTFPKTKIELKQTQFLPQCCTSQPQMVEDNFREEGMEYKIDNKTDIKSLQ